METLGVEYDATCDRMSFGRRFLPRSSEYRMQKEIFVREHNGSSPTEVVALIALITMTVVFHNVLWRSLCRKLPCLRRQQLLCMALNFVDVSVFLLLALCSPESLHLLLFSLSFATVALLALDQLLVPAPDRFSIISLTHQQCSETLNSSSRKRFISLYRAAFMLCTCVAILCVDFPFFPRRFVKTETFGYSLMDVGVGFVVFSSGVVSRSNRRSSIASVLSSVSPMLVLGCVRLAMVRALDYQAHVSEYGVHWNFFLTLALISALSALFTAPSLLGAVSVALVYQLALTVFGLEQYVLHAPRTTWVSANREGLCSSVGYLSLYMVGASVGRELRTNATTKQWWQRVAFLIIGGLLCFVALPASHHLVGGVSRRMANLPFVIWICALNLIVIGVLLALDLIERQPNVASTPILAAINKNQLFVFLLANQVTGAVNLSMQTLYADDRTSFVVMLAYLVVVCGSAVALHEFNVSLKFW